MSTVKDKSKSPEELGKKAKRKAEDVASAAKLEAVSTLNDARHELSSQADNAKNSAASEASDVAAALRDAAGKLRDGSPQERTLSQIASGIADASEAVKDKDLGELADTASDFARKHPAAFLGAAALLGFSASRFGKASTPKRSTTRRYSADYDENADEEWNNTPPRTAVAPQPTRTAAAVGGSSSAVGAHNPPAEQGVRYE